MATGKRGAPLGNKNSQKGREFQLALRRVFAQTYGSTSDGLDRLAMTLIDEAINKRQAWAVTEIANRFDGKPRQALLVGGDDEHPIVTKVIREIVNAGESDTDKDG
jgi:hypothetical protein